MNMHAAAPVVAKPLPKVRLATASDLEELLELGRELHRENGLVDLDEDMIREAAEAAILHGNGVFGVIGKNPIQAMIFLRLHRYWYSKNTHLEELLAFCREKYRRSDNAKALIEFAKTAALRLDVPLLIGIVSNHRTESKIRLYRRRLGPQAGAYFMFNGKTGA